MLVHRCSSHCARKKDVDRIDIYHWHKQKRASLDTFEAKLLRVFPQATIHKHAYVTEEAMSHVLCLHLVSDLLAQSDSTPALDSDLLKLLTRQDQQLQSFCDILAETAVSHRASNIVTCLSEETDCQDRLSACVQLFRHDATQLSETERNPGVSSETTSQQKRPASTASTPTRPEHKSSPSSKRIKADPCNPLLLFPHS